MSNTTPTILLDSNSLKDLLIIANDPRKVMMMYHIL